MIPRDVYALDTAGRRRSAIRAFDRWREIGADGLILGSMQKERQRGAVEMRLYMIASRQQAYAREYSGSIANPRLYAHTIADEVHQSQRQLRGVARTKLTFSSDREQGARRRAPSKIATSKRSTSATTTAPTSGGSRWAAS